MKIEDFLKAKEERKNIGKLINQINDKYEDTLKLLLTDILENLKTEDDIFLFFAQNASSFYAFGNNQMLYETSDNSWNNLENNNYSTHFLIERELFKGETYSWRNDICIGDCNFLLYVFKDGEQYKKISFEIGSCEGTFATDYDYVYKYELYSCVENFFEQLHEKCHTLIKSNSKNELAELIKNKCNSCKYFTVCLKKTVPIYECEVLKEFNEKNKIKEITYL